MKKPFAILFILVHLFYLGGYQLVFNQLEKESELKMAMRLDVGDYSDEELIEIRLPVNLPYQAYSSGFEQFIGEVEVDGLHYNYVKRKIQNDTLILLCIPNTDKSNVSTARETFFSLVNEFSKASDGKSAPAAPIKAIKFSIADFDTVGDLFQTNTVSTRISHSSVYMPGQLSAGFIAGSVQPPDGNS